MRIFIDCLVAYKEIERDLKEMGIQYYSETVQDRVLEGRDRETLELQAYGYKLFPTNNEFLGLDSMLWFNMTDSIKYEWIKKEAEERVLGCVSKNPGEAWKIYDYFWKQFLRDGKFSYTYVERIQEQLQYVIDELRSRPSTRQAIMTIYDRHQDLMNWGGRDRVPCSLSYHFLLRDNRLSLIYSQRSCDFHQFFKTDVYCAIKMTEHIANELNVELGPFTHVINSLHVFSKDVQGVF